jgi:hypothetical protein
MDGIVGPLKAYLKKSDPAAIDNFGFKLHYRATFVVLLVCMALVSARQYIGDPIQCIADGVPGGAMDLYCWIHSTFSVPGSWGEITEEYGVGSPKEISQDQPHPGVAPPDGDNVVHHKYYQWVVFVLFLQAACFHLPRLIWKHAEGGLMKMLVGDLTDPMMLIKKSDRSDKVEFIKKYFKESIKGHGPYALKFFFCEFLCLVNVIGQMYFTDKFLGYTFMTYGSDVFAMTFGDPEGRSDPMNMVFPKVTKCTFHKYGPSGTVTRHDGLCILALNIINEKIYVFLWFWFVGVAIFSALAIVYRMVVVLVPALRVTVICARALNQVQPETVKAIITSKPGWLNQVGDYWVIYLLSKNLNPIIMGELLKELEQVMAPNAYKPIEPNTYKPAYPGDMMDEKESRM